MNRQQSTFTAEALQTPGSQGRSPEPPDAKPKNPCPCDSCSGLKRRCDGFAPWICPYCEKHGYICIYSKYNQSNADQTTFVPYIPNTPRPKRKTRQTNSAQIPGDVHAAGPSSPSIPQSPLAASYSLDDRISVPLLANLQEGSSSANEQHIWQNANLNFILLDSPDSIHRESDEQEFEGSFGTLPAQDSSTFHSDPQTFESNPLDDILGSEENSTDIQVMHESSYHGLQQISASPVPFIARPYDRETNQEYGEGALAGLAAFESTMKKY